MTPSGPARLVSIGVPVYNGERHLAQALDSALAQDYSNLEVLISDNASTDGTEAVARRYVRADRRVRYWRNADDLGAVKNFGRVLAEAQGKYFTWLASDDFLSSPQYVSKSVGFLEDHPDVAVCGCDTHILDLTGPGALMPLRFPEIYPDRDPQDVRRLFFAWPQAIVCFAVYGMFRREALAHSRFSGRAWRGVPVVTHMEWPILLPVLERGRIVALPEFLRIYRCNFQSSWHRESGRLSGLDHFCLGLQMRGFLLKTALRLSLPPRQKIDLLARSLRNFFVVGLRTVSGEARRLRIAAEERRQLIVSLRADIDRNREALRQCGCDEPPASWPPDLAADEAPSRPRWRLPRRLEPIRDAVEELSADFFRSRSPRRQAEWRKDLVDSWTLRPLCEERLREILRLTAEAERCRARLRALESAAVPGPAQPETLG